MLGEAIATLIGKVLDRTFPDPAQKAEAALALAELQQAGEFKKLDADLAAMQMQADINKVEASSDSKFKSWPRPFVMWTCGVSFAYAAIVEPFMRFVATVAYHYAGPFPVIDTAITFQLLVMLLGLGGMRTVEKTRGAA